MRRVVALQRPQVTSSTIAFGGVEHETRPAPGMDGRLPLGNVVTVVNDVDHQPISFRVFSKMAANCSPIP
jgi:hypothetical protein